MLSMEEDKCPMHLSVEAGLHEVHGLGVCIKTLTELQAWGYYFAFRYGSEALAKAFAWLKGDEEANEKAEKEEDLFLLVAVKNALFALTEDPELTDARAVIAALERQGVVLTVKKAAL